MKLRIFLFLIATATCAFSDEGFAVVVNKANPATSISKNQLRQMMLGETSSWPGGAKVMVLFGPVGEGARVAALKSVCGMGESEFTKFTMQSSFAGGKAATKTLPSAASVGLVVKLTPGALGIVGVSGAGPDVKVLAVQ